MICGHLLLILSISPSTISIIPTTTTHLEIRKSVVGICLLNQIIQHCKVISKSILSRCNFYNNVLGLTRIHRLIISWKTDVGKSKETIFGSIGTVSIITQNILSTKSIHSCCLPCIFDCSILVFSSCISSS
jgi:hypothetical protein